MDAQDEYTYNAMKVVSPEERALIKSIFTNPSGRKVTTTNSNNKTNGFGVGTSFCRPSSTHSSQSKLNGGKKMTDEQTSKPTKGTWDRLGAKDTNKISFDVNIPHKVKFLTDVPEEIDSTESPGEVYYKFPVLEDGIEKHFTSSAWTLLGALKELAPLKDKEVTITKKLIKGKQTFEVN